MIYVAALAAPTKKAYGDKCLSTTVSKIIEQMNIDPAISQMDVCVLGVKDVTGINRVKVQAAIKTKHPDVCVIYIYQKDKEGELLEVPFKQMLKKITSDSVAEVVDKFIGSAKISSEVIRSKDNVAPKSEDVFKPKRARVSGAGVKGKLLKSVSKADSNEELPDIHEDTDLGLHYYTDLMGNVVYCDPVTREQIAPAVVQSTREKKAAERVAISAELEGIYIQEDMHPTKLVYMDQAGDIVPKDTPGAIIAEQEISEEDVTKGEEVIERTQSKIERNISEIKDFHDWGYFKQATKKDAIVRELLEENATFQGVVQMLSVMDEEVKAIFYDRGLTASQKTDKILEVGGRRSSLVAVQNDLISKKIYSIVDAITISTRRTIDEILDEHTKALDIINSQDRNLIDDTQLTELMNKRSALIFELLAMYKELVSVLTALETDVSSFVTSLDDNLPTSNEFINSLIGPIGEVFYPTNTAEIANKMMSLVLNTVSDKPGSLAVLSKSLMEFIDNIVRVLQTDEEIIQMHVHMSRILKAHRVEDAVVIDGILKNILHVYIGADESGRTATALTWSGCLTRRRNTLLIDISNNSKLDDYGVEAVELTEFMRSRIDKPLCVVRGKINDFEELTEMIMELKTRLDYYAYINVVIDSTQTDFGKILAEEALTVNFVCNCTNTSLDSTAKCYKAIDNNNVARKLLLIDPPVPMLDLAKRVGADPTITKCVVIPAVQKVKTCAVVHTQPYEYPEVRSIYEEAFR